jgi:GR25 family glycosyltransferase involved in LPS biosynthesis
MNFKYSTLGFDKVYVINLKRRKDRKERLIKENPEIDFTFIEAIDGKEITKEQLIESGLLNPSFYDPTGMVTMGIFACALSHKKAWDQALADGVENALFLEDDINFETPFIEDKSFTPLYQDILSDLKQFDWDLIQFGKKSKLQNGIFVGKYWVVPRYKSNFNGAHTYAATREMIQTLSDNCLPVKYAADVYIEGFYNTHNLFTLKESLIRQNSDSVDPQNADSDTYYNDYRESGGKIGISFDEKGNVINKRLAQYLKHPKDILQQHTEIILERPKFGLQKFNQSSFFGLSSMLKLIKDLDKDSKMIELYSHLGESTFYFGCSGLFKNIYCVDPLRGEDKFNIDNNLTWEDIKVGFHSNTYHFKNINHIEKEPSEIVDSFEDISFLYINNREDLDTKSLIDLYLPKIKETGFIGGNGPIDFKPSITFEDGSWLIKKEDYEL